MSESSTQVQLVVNDAAQSFELESIGLMDVSGVEAYRGGEAAPEGIYEWRIKGMRLETKEIMDNSLSPPAKVPRACVFIDAEAIACRSCKDPAIDPTNLVGLEHSEMIAIRDARKDVGRVIAFMEDIGFNGTGNFQELLAQTTGMEFVAPIKHTTNKNDTSKKYANFDLLAVSPLNPTTGTVAATPAQQPSAPAPASAAPVQGGIQI